MGPQGNLSHQEELWAPVHNQVRPPGMCPKGVVGTAAMSYRVPGVQQVYS